MYALETVVCNVGGRKLVRRYNAQKWFIMWHSRREDHELSLDILARGQSWSATWGHLRLRQFGANVHTWNDVLDYSTLQTVKMSC